MLLPFEKKLPAKAHRHLSRIRVSSIEPSTLVLNPLYVYLSQNAKFTVVKLPYEFLTAENLAVYCGYEFFYFPFLSKGDAKGRQGGESLRHWLKKEDLLCSLSEVERESEILKKLAHLRLQNKSGKLLCEWSWIVFFINELCGSYSENTLQLLQHVNGDDIRQAVAQSSLITFLALLLGYNDLEYLAQTRDALFESRVGDYRWKGPTEIESLRNILEEALPFLQDPFDLLLLGRNKTEWVAKKLQGQLFRLSEGGGLFGRFSGD